MTPSFPASASHHPDPGHIHELARQRATQLRREAQARWLDGAARCVAQAAGMARTGLTRWLDRPLPTPPRSAATRQAHRPCA